MTPKIIDIPKPEKMYGLLFWPKRKLFVKPDDTILVLTAAPDLDTALARSEAPFVREGKDRSRYRLDKWVTLGVSSGPPELIRNAEKMMKELFGGGVCETCEGCVPGKRCALQDGYWRGKIEARIHSSRLFLGLWVRASLA